MGWTDKTGGSELLLVKREMASEPTELDTRLDSERKENRKSRLTPGVQSGDWVSGQQRVE